MFQHVIKISIILLLLLTFLPITKAQNFHKENNVRNHRILLIGDSQTVGAFGSALSITAHDNGAEYFVRSGEIGWNVNSWWTHRLEIRNLIRRHQPTLILIQLGGNDFNRALRPEYPGEVSRFWEYVTTQSRTNVAHGRQVKICWIGSPTAVGRAANIQSRRNRAIEIIRQTIGVNYFVESRDITGSFGRTPDGLHFTRIGGINWSTRILPRINHCIASQ